MFRLDLVNGDTLYIHEIMRMIKTKGVCSVMERNLVWHTITSACFEELTRPFVKKDTWS